MPADLDPLAVAQLDESAWLAQVYRRGAAQLTVRAVATGLLLGAVLASANVYVGLKTGWFLGMALVACLGAFGLWRGLAALGLARAPLTLLELNCAQSTASSAAFATGGMMVGAAPALLLLSVAPGHPLGVQPDPLGLAAWVACSAALGVSLAVPLKRQLINRERLPFPSGTAAAVLLHALHRGGAAAGARSRRLLAALGLGALVPILRDGIGVLPARSTPFDLLPGVAAGGEHHAASEVGVVLDHGLVLVAAGVFVGPRTCAWMVVGGLITALGLGPAAIDAGPALAPADLARRLAGSWADVGIWAGAPMLVAYAAIAVLAAAPATLRGWRRSTTAPRGPLGEVEVPLGWSAIGVGASATAVLLLGQRFGIPPWLGAIAVAASALCAAVAGRITGETDVTPGGPIAKLGQLGFGALRPQHPASNLYAASMVHAASVACADLLTDLKAGYLLGADPRRQWIAQALGIAAGAAASVLTYRVLVPDAGALLGVGGEAPAFAAPAAHQFRAIAELAQHGFERLAPLERGLVALGAGAGVVLAALERALPAAATRWAPSTAGLGLGLLLPAGTSIAMLLGAVAAGLATRRRPAAAAQVAWPLAAGALAGESVAGVAIAVLRAL